jgi:hypothetical protein
MFQSSTNQQQEDSRRNNSNNLVVPGAAQAIDQMKNEIAQEFGVQLGPEQSSRSNGSVGGEITRRLVALAQQQINGSTSGNKSSSSFFPPS